MNGRIILNHVISAKIRIIWMAVLLFLGGYPGLVYASGGNSGKITTLQSQDEKKMIEGTVTDESGLPVPGVSVVVKGTTVGAITDLDGNYFVTVPQDAEILVFSFIGMETQEIIIGGRTTINVVLRQTMIGLDEVVAVGYGTQKKANLTGSVASVDYKQLENRGVANVSSALSGQLPGVTVLQRGGSPGKNEGTIRIRGIGTFGNTNPLIMVDGVETGSLSELDPNNIESISVLKDAASAAIYGVRAANGVILVTTKRGKEGAMKITYSGQVGISEPTRLPEKVNAYELATLYNEALKNEGSPVRFSRDELEKFKAGNTDAYADVDHVDEVFSKTGIRNIHNLTLSGGSKDTKYNVGLGYVNDGGLIANTGYERYNLRVNLDHQLSDKFTVGLNLAGAFNEVTEPALGVPWVIHTAYREWATDALRFSDGRWAYPTHAENQEHNSLAYASDLGNKTFNDNRVSTTLFAEYELMKGLKVKGLISNIRDFNKTSTWVRGVDLYKIDPKTGVIDDEPNESHFGSTSKVGRDYFENNDLNIDLLLNYEKAIDNHNIKGLLGFNQRRIDKEWGGMSRTGLTHPDLDQINGADPTNDATYGNAVDYRSRSAFGRINYTYNDRYLVEFNLRYDGTSRFPEHQRFEYFPSISVGWRLSEEEFFQVPIVSNLKLRGSWGQLGNQEIGDYTYLASIVTGADYVWNNELMAGVAEKYQAANTDIRWETTTISNIGVDVGLFDQKLSLIAEYFIKDTKDILGQVPLPGIFGAGEPITNQLAVRNQGFEIQIGYQDKIGELNYNVGFNFSKVKNKITDLAGTDSPGRSVGDPIANIYGYVADGIFQNQAEVKASPDQSALGGMVEAGDLKYKDINNDGVINADDRTNLGSFFPGMDFGFRAGASLKGFDFSMVWQGVADVDALIGGRQQQPFLLGASPWKVHLDRTEVKNGQVVNPGAAYPRTTFGNANNFVPSSWWVKSTAFVKLRNLQLGYTLPKTVVEKLNLEKVRVSISGENLLTLTSYEGFDPETPTMGDPLGLNSSNGYPPVRTYLMGINVTF
ncbi:TonB-dependent receptor [Marinilabiliaceae bacterium JC017]|nr:TonB-dependent receptor [Marinilabiliaceae bacterium JC017]